VGHRTGMDVMAKIRITLVGFEVFTAVVLKSIFFWDMGYDAV
jgi:hypothetical protein